ncbi:phosphoglycerate mutase family protein [Bdellovibrio sp. 22V]|uniref:phosphoglycerate mutase family protein n=1 Tax=Bdellovibrio sp. 22V TaxID=3044166 RepID=UPI00254343AF|nr:phosphoglycerate mutase family protein [Bdellovibrio sp. 22V]WII73823.1 phosphoglycerate mutase family protein [Bdellovibrio sp. 22V]
MKIYLFRHAQKAMDFSGDPDLTPEGHAQASKLLDKVLKNELPTPTELWVSPKKRTHSTFRPLSQYFKLPMQIHESLLEQQPDETISHFQKRIDALFEEAAQKKNAVVFFCSHYDVVLEAMNVITSDKDLSDSEFSHWSPCQYIGFETDGQGLYEFIEFKRVQL